MKSFKLWRFDKILATLLSVHLIFFSIEAALVRTAAVALLVPIGVVGCSSEDASKNKKEAKKEEKCEKASLKGRLIGATLSALLVGAHHFYFGKWYIGLLYLFAFIVMTAVFPIGDLGLYFLGFMDAFYILFVITDEELCDRIEEGKIISSWLR